MRSKKLDKYLGKYVIITFKPDYEEEPLKGILENNFKLEGWYHIVFKESKSFNFRSSYVLSIEEIKD